MIQSRQDLKISSLADHTCRWLRGLAQRVEKASQDQGDHKTKHLWVTVVAGNWLVGQKQKRLGLTGKVEICSSKFLRSLRLG